MSKDPAVLFYTSDFMIGVVGLTMQERGQYISLLCTQHQQGHLSEKTICLLLGIVSVSEIPDVMEKFKVDESGKYYNERMELEAEKRHNFVESRKENAKLGGRPKKNESKHINNHTKNHMDTHMGNVNEDKDDSILDSSNMELRVDRVESNIPNDSYLEQGEQNTTSNKRKSSKEQKQEKVKKIKNNFDEPDRVQNYIPFVDEYQFSDKLREAIINWFDFKLECGFAYKTRPLKTLLAQIKEKAEEVGDKPMISRINTAVSSSWKGINIETMDGFSGNVPKFQNKAGRFEQIDFDKIEV
jgi:hypothetical protein